MEDRKIKSNLDSKERVRLIAKGNQAFNAQNYELAGRIFKTVKYQDGLIRMGDLFLEQENYFQAIEFYSQAKYLYGEYRTYIKMGLVANKFDFHDLKEREKMDDIINKKLAQTISIMMKKD